MAPYKAELVHLLAIRLSVSLQARKVENNASSLYDELMRRSDAQR